MRSIRPALVPGRDVLPDAAAARKRDNPARHARRSGYNARADETQDFLVACGLLAATFAVKLLLGYSLVCSMWPAVAAIGIIVLL